MHINEHGVKYASSTSVENVKDCSQIGCVTGVFPKWNSNSLNLVNLINHCSMNWVQFKDPVSHMCLTGAVLNILVSKPRGGRFKPFYCNDKYF